MGRQEMSQTFQRCCLLQFVCGLSFVFLMFVAKRCLSFVVYRLLLFVACCCGLLCFVVCCFSLLAFVVYCNCCCRCVLGCVWCCVLFLVVVCYMCSRLDCCALLVVCCGCLSCVGVASLLLCVV